MEEEISINDLPSPEQLGEGLEAFTKAETPLLGSSPKKNVVDDMDEAEKGKLKGGVKKPQEGLIFEIDAEFLKPKKEQEHEYPGLRSIVKEATKDMLAKTGPHPESNKEKLKAALKSWVNEATHKVANGQPITLSEFCSHMEKSGYKLPNRPEEGKDTKYQITKSQDDRKESFVGIKQELKNGEVINRTVFHNKGAFKDEVKKLETRNKFDQKETFKKFGVRPKKEALTMAPDVDKFMTPGLPIQLPKMK